MKFRVVSYLNVVPRINTSQEKIDILTKFPVGVNRLGDVGLIHSSDELIDCDVAVIQGWQHERGKTASHLKLRQNIIEYQLNRSKFVCVADSNLFLYANKENKPHHYLRYSFNGIFPNTGIYFDTEINPARWQQISKDLKISLENYKVSGTNIVICCQRDGGWSMGKISVYDWVVQTIAELKKYSDKNIVIRPHPKDKKSVLSYLPKLQTFYKHDSKVQISNLDTPLQIDLRNAWAVVNHNSSSVVGPIIQGYHAFITDPEKSQNAEVSNTDLSLIENPGQFDRERWLERISMFHWKFSELEDGTAWAHIKKYVI